MNCSLCKYRSNLIGFESEVGLAQESHHHHVEGISESCTLCEDECTSECDLIEGQKHKNEHYHSHERIKYPNSDHPLGPVTLQKSNQKKI